MFEVYLIHGEDRRYLRTPVTFAISCLRKGVADGICFDYVNDEGVTECSYELVPGRPIVGYHGDECHE